MDPTKRNFLIGSLFGAVALGTLLPAACAMRRMGQGPATLPGSSPKRPTGNARPMLEEDIAPQLSRLDAWYAENLPADKYVFNPPATAAEIASFEALVGRRMPPSFHQLYLWHDGEDNDRFGHFYGLPLMPLRAAADEWNAWGGVLSSLKGNRYVVGGGAWPEGAVDPSYINRHWIPLTHDSSGNHIGLDLDPWPGGRIGQVILFGRDEDVKVVLADSLGQFLSWIADLLEGGNFRLAMEEGEQALREFRLKTPRVDHFHEGARQLLGAPGQFL